VVCLLRDLFASLSFSGFSQCSGFDFGFAFIVRAFLRASSLPAVAGVSVVNFGFGCGYTTLCPWWLKVLAFLLPVRVYWL
jgi:hypothetical protein